VTTRSDEFSWRRADVWLSVPALACMLGADLCRTGNATTATELSMAGWVFFVAQIACWTRGNDGWRTTCAWLLRVLLVAVAAFATLYLYYARARYLEAGVHVDVVYTYIGLQWFLELHNPITFAGQTISYCQLPFALLTHLPGLVLGIDRLGAFAVHFGAMVEMALLLAVIAHRLVPGSPLRQVAAGVIASAVFSNRMMVLSYNTAAYAMPAIALALMVAVIATDRSPSGPDRVVGGLLALALLHHYPGWTMVLPFVVAWLVVRRHPVAKTRAFLVANPFLVTVAGMATITLAVRPELLLTRIHDVTRGPSPDLMVHVRDNWRYLSTAFPRVRFREFVQECPGSWFLLNTPPLARWALPIMGATWLVSALTIPGRMLRYLGLLLFMIGELLLLTVAQHLLTDFSDYRDYPLVHAATVAGLLFAIRSTCQPGWRGRCAAALALAVACYNWGDVTALRGKRFNYYDYAPRAQEAFERLRGLAGSERFRSWGATRVVVVGEDFIPLEGPYRAVLRRDGIEVRLVKLTDYCSGPEVAVQNAADSACQAFLVVVPETACNAAIPIPQREAKPGLTARLYRSVCSRAEPAPRLSEPVALDG
jgi:hypothetical protein